MQRRAVDEDEAIQVEDERLPRADLDGFETLFDLSGVREVELTRYFHEDHARIAGLALLEDIGGRVSVQGRPAYASERVV